MEDKFATGLQVGVMIAAVLTLFVDAGVISMHFVYFVLLIIAMLTIMFDDSQPNRYA